MGKFNFDDERMNLSKSSIDFDRILIDYFDIYNIYLANFPEDKRDEISFRIKESFKSNFYLDFDFKKISIALKKGDKKLRSFFIHMNEFLIQYNNGLVNFEETHIKKMFFNFSKVYTLNNYNNYSDNEDLMHINIPNRAVRYSINDIISSFCHDVINGEKNLDVYLKNIDIILSFLYLSVFTQFDKKYQIVVDENVKSFQNYFSTHFTSMKRDGTLVAPNSRKKRFDNISDIFAHISGNIEFSIFDDTIYFRNMNSMNLEINLQEFLEHMNELFTTELKENCKLSSSDSLDTVNRRYENVIKNIGVIGPMLKLIEKLENQKKKNIYSEKIKLGNNASDSNFMNEYNNVMSLKGMDNITKEEIVLVMSYLVLCYNQEGLLNPSIMSQYSLVDSSNFYLEYGRTLIDSDYNEIQIFKSHDMIYVDDNSEILMLPWKDYLTTGNENVTLCDISKMAYDNTNGVFFPTSEVIKHIRNALRHGRVSIEGNSIKFFDQSEYNDPSTRYFFLEISLKNFMSFLDNNILTEVMHTRFLDLYDNSTTVKDYNSKLDYKKHFFYKSESAYAKNSFSNFIDVCRTHFPNLGIDNFVDDLCENNLISRYLVDNPEKFPEFLEYRFSDGRRLLDLICLKYCVKNTFLDDNLYAENPCDAIKKEIYQLMEFEELIPDVKNSIFFKYFASYLISKDCINPYIGIDDIFLYRKVMYLKNDYSSLLSCVADTKELHQLLLGLGLYKHPEIDELHSILYTYINYIYIKERFGFNNSKVFDYNNYVISSPESVVAQNAKHKILKQYKLKRFINSSISKLMNFVTLSSYGVIALLSIANYSGFIDATNICNGLYAVAFPSLIYWLVDNVFMLSSYNDKVVCDFRLRTVEQEISEYEDTDNIYQNRTKGGI